LAADLICGHRKRGQRKSRISRTSTLCLGKSFSWQGRRDAPRPYLARNGVLLIGFDPRSHAALSSRRHFAALRPRALGTDLPRRDRGDPYLWAGSNSLTGSTRHGFSCPDAQPGSAQREAVSSKVPFRQADGAPAGGTVGSRMHALVRADGHGLARAHPDPAPDRRRSTPNRQQDQDRVAGTAAKAIRGRCSSAADTRKLCSVIWVKRARNRPGRFFEIRDQGAQSSIRGIKSGQLPRMPKRRGKIPMARAIETSAISTRPGLSGAADALRRQTPLRGKAEIRAQKEVIGAPGLHSQP
jgi:hypothetical protein